MSRNVDNISIKTYIYYVEYDTHNKIIILRNCADNSSKSIQLPKYLKIESFDIFINELAICFSYFKIPQIKIDSKIPDIYYFWINIEKENWEEGFFMCNGANIQYDYFHGVFSLPNPWHHLTKKNIFTVNPNEIFFHFGHNETNENIVKYFKEKNIQNSNIHNNAFSSAKNVKNNFSIIMGNIQNISDNNSDCINIINFLKNRLKLNVYTEKADIDNCFAGNNNFIIVIAHHSEGKIELKNGDGYNLDNKISFANNEKYLQFWCCNIDIKQSINWNLINNITLNIHVSEAATKYFNEHILSLIINDDSMGLKTLIFDKKIKKDEIFNLFTCLDNTIIDKINKSPLLL